MKPENAPETPATKFLRQHGIAHSNHLYDYEEHGGTRVSSRELNVAEHAVIKTLVMEDEAGKPLFAFHIDNSNDDYKVTVQVYDAAGTAYPATAANEDKIEAATAAIVALMNKRAALEATLAGQEAPEAQELILPRQPEE